MVDINLIINRAYKKNNSVSYDDIGKMNLSEEEMEELLILLNKSKIEIIESDNDNDAFINSRDQDLYIEYLKDICKYPILSYDEEVELSKK